MKAYEIEELINKVETSTKDVFLINVEETGWIELSKKQVLTILKNEFSTKSIEEFKTWLKERNLKYNHLAEKLSIHPVKFTQIMNGTLKSTKSIGSNLDFIERVKSVV